MIHSVPGCFISTRTCEQSSYSTTSYCGVGSISLKSPIEFLFITNKINSMILFLHSSADAILTHTKIRMNTFETLLG